MPQQDTFQSYNAWTQSKGDLLCFSHLRWDFVFQRPQHLLTRCATSRRVFYIEEPIFTNQADHRLEVSKRESGVIVVQPHLPGGLRHEDVIQAQMHLIDDLIVTENIEHYAAWYYTPMALSFTRQLSPDVIIFDCMDELSLFKHAPKELLDNEAELLKKADVVFTGGQSLYEAKKDKHHNIYPFPSSIDFEHFSAARKISKSATRSEPQDQADIPHPRMGFFGVLDERLDIELIAEVAEARPDWHLVLIGPVVKIDEESLPKRHNIHYLGGKNYQELPQYIAGWDVAMMPFAKNDSTKFISPTKTPEYLAAGKPVVSTSIRDVVRPYHDLDLVKIADTPAEFIRAAAAIGMDEGVAGDNWLSRVDSFLSQTSWDKTWHKMSKLIELAHNEKNTRVDHRRVSDHAVIDRLNSKSIHSNLNPRSIVGREPLSTRVA